MPFERKNPIPPGTYWIDVYDESVLSPERLPAFESWMSQHGVEELGRKRTVMGSPLDWGRPVNTWVLFRVSKPTPRWPLALPIGLPTIASKGAETKPEDTAKRPAKQSVREHWGVPEMKMPHVAPAVVAGLLLWWAMKK